MIRTLLIDHSSLCQAFLASLKSLEKELRLVELVQNSHEALEILEHSAIDLVVAKQGLCKELQDKKCFSKVVAIELDDLDEQGKISLRAFQISDCDQKNICLKKMLQAVDHGFIYTKEKKFINLPGIYFDSKILNWNPQKDRFICIGASTGGVEAISSIIKSLPPLLSVPLIIILHIPEAYTKNLLEQWQRISSIPVLGIRHNDVLKKNKIYIALTHRHVKISTEGKFQFDSSIPVNNFCPSISTLFLSVIESGLSKNCMAILLTGLGYDGAHELVEIKKKGGKTLVQEKESCAVFGLGASAMANGQPTYYAPLKDIPEIIKSFSRN